MPISHNEILQLIDELAQCRELKVCVRESLKGAATVGGCALIGSLVGGPVGLVVGSLLGSGVAYSRGKDKYSSVPHIICYEMTDAQRRQLTSNVHRIVQHVDATDAAMLLSIIMRNSSLEAMVLREITGFFSNEMGYAITS